MTAQVQYFNPQASFAPMTVPRLPGANLTAPRLLGNSMDGYMSHSLNSFKGVYIGGYIGDYYRGY